MEELKPVRCGCGGEAKVDKQTTLDGDGQKMPCWVVYCTNCLIVTDAQFSEAEAITAWNKAMGAKDINVPDKESVIVEPFTTDMTHVGYCRCGYLVNAEWHYCPKCGRKIQWGLRYV